MINTVKNEFVKIKVGGREVNLNLDNVFKYTVFFFRVPLSFDMWLLSIPQAGGTYTYFSVQFL